MNIQAEFLCGVPDPVDAPIYDLPEIAFVGRSNAGKSTLLNRICERKNLARTSSKPGATREFNFFHMTFGGKGSSAVECVFADLPGYGYSKLSKTRRAEIGAGTLQYLETREALIAICALIDSKRNPEDEERIIQEVAFSRGIPFIPLATKIDRLKKNEARKRQQEIARAFHLEAGDVLCTGLKQDIQPLRQQLLNFL